MCPNFNELANRLATTAGGFTLWIGAGASIATTDKATPSWKELVSGIEHDHNVKVKEDNLKDFPMCLEELSEAIGHRIFRKELRIRLVDAIDPSKISPENFAAQAVIGARATAVVSFNLEPITAWSFPVAHGGDLLNIRTFQERSSIDVVPEQQTKPGVAGMPIYFPHGLLLFGNAIVTKSDYDRLMGSLAMLTAVHLAIGGDLIILGMSLGDSYLRKALLEQRRWLRNIYWLNSSFEFREWARVARVCLVEVNNLEVWTELAKVFISADQKEGELAKVQDHIRSKAKCHVEKLKNIYRSQQENLNQRADKLISSPETTAEQIGRFAQFCFDSGRDVPENIERDQRYQTSNYFS